jgi:hypothetical protein
VTLFVAERSERARRRFTQAPRSRDGRRGLGDDAPVPAPSVATTVRGLLQQARAAALAGRSADASNLVSQAQAIANNTDQPSYFSDEFTYTQQVLAGDSTPATLAPGVTDPGGAVGSAANQAQRDAIAQQNAKPDSVLDAAVSGFGDGVKEQVQKMQQQLKAPLGTDWKTIGIYAGAIGVGLVALNAFFSGLGKR